MYSVLGIGIEEVVRLVDALKTPIAPGDEGILCS